MQNALRVTWETLLDWWNSMVGLATMNLIWLGLSLTVVLFPPATAGIYSVTHSMAHGKGHHAGEFFDAARRYAWISLRWALANLVVGAVFAVNFVFYGTLNKGWTLIIQVILAGVGIVWLAAQLYVWPFLMEQEQKRLRVALRNALFLTLANPLYSLVLLAVSGLVIVISLGAVLPFAVFTVSFLSLLGNRAVVERLTAYGKLPAPVHSLDFGDKL